MYVAKETGITTVTQAGIRFFIVLQDIGDM